MTTNQIGWAIIAALFLTLAVATVIVNIAAAHVRHTWKNEVDEPMRHARRRPRGGRRAR